MGTEFYLSGILLIILFFCALRDWKERIIPNIYLIRGIAIRVLFLFHEVSVEGEKAITNLLLKAGVCFLFFGTGILIRKITRNGIGMGDIKLVMLMFLYLETMTCLSSLFASLILSMIHVVVLRSRKKKQTKVPFAPSLLAGTVVVMICTI